MSSKKAFFRAFIVTFLIMAAVGIFVLADIPDLSVPKQNQSSAPPQNLSFTPSAEDKFTVLLTLTAKPDRPPYAYFLLNFDGVERNVNILRLPAQTVLSKDC